MDNSDLTWLIETDHRFFTIRFFLYQSLHPMSKYSQIPPESGSPAVFPDDLLSPFGAVAFELKPAEAVQFCVFSERVVETLDVIDDIASGPFPGSLDLASATPRVQRREEALHSRVVPTFIALMH